METDKFDAVAGLKTEFIVSIEMTEDIHRMLAEICFNLTDTFGEIEFEDEQRQWLGEPSGLGQVALCRDWWGDKWRLVDFTGTTNEEAIKKILTFYKHKTYRRGVGDHLFFEGFYERESIIAIRLGS